MIEKRLTGEKKSSVCVKIKMTCQSTIDENIRKRQTEGIAAAKANVMKFGSPDIKAPDNFPEIVQKWGGGVINVYEAAEMCCMCEFTFYHRLREYWASITSKK